MSRGGYHSRWACRWGAPWLALLLAFTSCSPTASLTDEELDQNIVSGRAERKSGFHVEAERAFLRALSNNPNSATAHRELGILYYEDLRDWIGALYHFDRFLKLQPKSKYSGLIEGLRRVCKEELAKDVPLDAVNIQMQRAIERLVRTNTALQQELEQVKVQLAQRPPPNPVAGPVVVSNLLVPPAGGFRPPATASVQRLPPTRPDPSLAASNAPPSRVTAMRTHRVKARETLAAIARQYRVTLEQVQAANPNVDPRRLRPGQIVNVPAP